MSLGLIVEFKVKPEHAAAFDEAIAINARASVEKEPGCFQFDVLRDNKDPTKIVLYEIYADEAAFKAHLDMEHTKVFLGKAKEWVSGQSANFFTRTVAPPVKAR